MIPTLVAIPMKDPADAKQRLALWLPRAMREALVFQLLGQTMRRLRKAQELEPSFDIAIVTRSARIAACAQSDGVPVIRDLGLGLNGAIGAAGAWATEKGYHALCALPGDLADPRPEDLAALLGQAQPGALLLCPSSDGGTNALLKPVQPLMRLHYGLGSLEAHIRSGRAAGLEPRVLDLPSLRVDVDRPQDLASIPPGLRAACRLDILNARENLPRGSR